MCFEVGSEEVGVHLEVTDVNVTVCSGHPETLPAFTQEKRRSHDPEFKPASAKMKKVHFF